MPTSYERIPQEGDDEFWETRPPSVRAELQRPFVYYGTGPFDPPSSDEEEEDVALEKENAHSPTAAESALLGDDEEGGKKKRPASLRWLVISLVTLVVLAGLLCHYNVFRVFKSPGLFRSHWSFCCSDIYTCKLLSSSGGSTHYHGPYLQWNFQCRE